MGGEKLQFPVHNDTTEKTTEKSEVKLNKTLFKNYSPDNFWVKLAFLISAVSLTFLLSIAPSSIYSYVFLIPSVILGLIIWLYLVFKKNLLQKIWKKTSKLICGIALVLSCCTAWIFGEGLFNNISSTVSKVSLIGYDFIINYVETPEFLNEHNVISQYLPYVKTVLLHTDVLTVGFIAVLCLVTLYSLYLLWKFLLTIIIPAVRNFITGLDNIERWYLTIGFVLAVVGIGVLYNLTNVFYHPIDINGTYHQYDVLFQIDTGARVANDVYTNISHSGGYRCLFGLFAFPFGLLAFIISKILFFIPLSFNITIAIIQFLLLCITGILLSRMIKLQRIHKLLFIITYSFSFGFLIFSLTLEQFIFPTFWLILFVYAVVMRGKYADWKYVAATGSLLPSGILFPFLSKKFDIKKYLSVAGIFLCVTLLSGRLASLLGYFLSNGISSSINKFNGSGSITWIEKLQQYINFGYSSLFFDGEIHLNSLQYEAIPVTTINIFGLIIFGLIIIGFIVNRNNVFAKICFVWFLFSFGLLGIIGFGSAQNCFSLYSLYFGWAFLSLIYLLIKKVLGNQPKIMTVVLICFLLLIAVVNIPGIISVISFGIQYYPVV